MATFMDKALAYLGLKDVEDDDFFDDYGPEDDETAAMPTPTPRAHTVFPERERDRFPERDRFAERERERERETVPVDRASSTVRTLSRDEVSANGSARHGVVRPLVPSRTARPRVVTPSRFSDAQEIGDLVKQSNPVIVNLQVSDRDLSRRMIDFCSGLTYALAGTMEKVADQVFLLTPSNVEVSAEERQRLQERGLIES